MSEKLEVKSQTNLAIIDVFEVWVASSLATSSEQDILRSSSALKKRFYCGVNNRHLKIREAAGEITRNTL